MEFVTEVFKIIQIVVVVAGVGPVISGYEDFSTGKGQHNAGKKDEGIGKMLGGVAVIVIAYIFIPKIPGWIFNF